MSDYTPTTEDVRTACEKALRAIYPLAYRRRAFDRWLKQVKAEVWDECCDETMEQGTVQIPDNPYRQETDR